MSFDNNNNNNNNNNKYDFLIFGATGFTGIRIAEWIAKENKANNNNVKWAICGRSSVKLENLKKRLEEKQLPLPDGTLIGDVSDNDSMMKIAQQGKLLLNCTGPYRFLGEPVVSACLKAKTDYVDLCGEPEFMERIFLKYHDMAIEKGVMIIHACAFDSVPADLGCLFASRQFKGPAICTQIESYLTIHTGPLGGKGNITTFEAAVHGFGSAKDLSKVRKEVKQKYPSHKINYLGKRLKAKTGPFFDPQIQRYCFKFPGSDASVVRSTHRGIALLSDGRETTFPQYSTYFTVGSAWSAFMTAVIGGTFGKLAQYECGRNLLLKFPGFFSCGGFGVDGPSQEQMDTTSFSMKFYAKGCSGLSGQQPSTGDEALPLKQDITLDKTVVTLVSGPEPGYVATPLIFVTLSKCLIEERSKLPSGGVFTPGAAFANTNLIERLNNAGLQFSIVQP